MPHQKTTNIRADVVTNFRGMTPAQGGEHVLLKLDIAGIEKFLAVEPGAAVDIGLNLMGGAMRCQKLKGNDKAVAAMLPAHDMDVVSSAGRVLLRIVTEGDVAFAFTFEPSRVSEFASRFADLAILLSAPACNTEPY